MSTAVAPSPYDVDSDPIWRMVLGSMTPKRWRDRMIERWLNVVPLLVIIGVQIGMTLRLTNTAFRDEGLYIWTGHRMWAHWFDGAVLYDKPDTYFSGAPWFYPPIAGAIDRVGGLELVRAFSLVWMIVATAAIYYVAKTWFSRNAGLIGALAFALAGPTQHLGAFATFDAMSLGMLALALALGVRAVNSAGHRLAWAVPAGLLLTTAVVAKYAALMFVPFILVAVFLTSHEYRRRAALRTSIVMAATFAVLLTVTVTTFGHAAYKGFIATTTSARNVTEKASIGDIGSQVWHFAGLWWIAAAIGVLVLAVRQRRYVLPVLLLAAMVAPAAYQAKLGEATSLDKHLDFGLVFGAGLIGVALTQTKRLWERFTGWIAVVVLAIVGASTSHWIFNEWSNQSALVDTINYSVEADPYIRTLGEPYESVRYHFEGKTQYWQFDTTDPIVALYYQPVDRNGVPIPGTTPKTGMEAAEAGLKDNYWQLVYFNGSTGASQQLMPKMESFGYKLTNKVVLHNNRGDDTYFIYQRWPNQ